MYDLASWAQDCQVLVTELDYVILTGPFPFPAEDNSPPPPTFPRPYIISRQFKFFPRQLIFISHPLFPAI